MYNKAYEYINNSFLKPLLSNKKITDISYNGKDLYYQDNKGKHKSNIKLSLENANNFIRQIANLTEQMFSLTTPILDVSIQEYRFNAVHSSICRKLYEKCATFALRKGSKGINADTIIATTPNKVFAFLKTAIQNKKSIVICGETGSGKTELQKYLLTFCNRNSRIIVIDNVSELIGIDSSNMDITYWQYDVHSSYCTLDDLISNSLRFNPDWTIITEARGKEMYPIIRSILTGHPLITTIHAKNLETTPSRILQMIMQSTNNTIDPSILMNEIYSAFDIGVHVAIKYENGVLIRYIDQVGVFKSDLSFKIIYDTKEDNNNDDCRFNN